MANSRSGDGVIDRVVRVLATFDAEHTTQTATQIARRAALPGSTAHRMVGDLVAGGLLERDEEGRLRVGIRLWELATRGSLALGLRQAALPAMEGVQAALRQHTQLAILDDDQVLVLERLSHPDAGANITRVAGRLPVHATSSGLVLLAAAPPEVLDRVLAGPLTPLSSETITNPALLRRKISEVRRLGYAISAGAIASVSTGIAVPVRDYGSVVAALGVVLPRDAVDERRTVGVLRAAAAEIERQLVSTHSAFR